MFFWAAGIALYLGVSTFNFAVMHKMKNDTRDKILKLIEDKGYIFDKHYYDQIFKNIDFGYHCYHSYKFDKEEILLCSRVFNLFPFFNFIPTAACVKYLLGNYDSETFEVYNKHYKYVKTNIDKAINSWKDNYLEIDPTFEYKKKLESLELNHEEQLVHLMDKYDEDNKDTSNQIIINQDDDLDVLLDKVNQLQALIKSKQEHQNVDSVSVKKKQKSLKNKNINKNRN